MELFGSDTGVLLEEPVDVPLRLGDESGIDGFADDDISFPVVYLLQVLLHRGSPYDVHAGVQRWDHYRGDTGFIPIMQRRFR